MLQVVWYLLSYPLPLYDKQTYWPPSSSPLPPPHTSHHLFLFLTSLSCLHWSVVEREVRPGSLIYLCGPEVWRVLFSVVSSRLSGSVGDVLRPWGLAWILHYGATASWTVGAGEEAGDENDYVNTKYNSSTQTSLASPSPPLVITALPAGYCCPLSVMARRKCGEGRPLLPRTETLTISPPLRQPWLASQPTCCW